MTRTSVTRQSKQSKSATKKQGKKANGAQPTNGARSPTESVFKTLDGR
jgi:hypothetical protein